MGSLSSSYPCFAMATPGGSLVARQRPGVRWQSAAATPLFDCGEMFRSRGYQQGRQTGASVGLLLPSIQPLPAGKLLHSATPQTPLQQQCDSAEHCQTARLRHRRARHEEIVNRPGGIWVEDVAGQVADQTEGEI